MDKTVIDRTVSLYDKGLTIKQLARVLGVHASTVHRRIAKARPPGLCNVDGCLRRERFKGPASTGLEKLHRLLKLRRKQDCINYETVGDMLWITYMEFGVSLAMLAHAVNGLSPGYVGDRLVILGADIRSSGEYSGKARASVRREPTSRYCVSCGKEIYRKFKRVRAGGRGMTEICVWDDRYTCCVTCRDNWQSTECLVEMNGVLLPDMSAL